MYSKGFNCIATEVSFSKYCDYLKDYDWFNSKALTKGIIDVVGVKGNMLNLRQDTLDTLDKYKVMGIEAKASYQDFLNGFCCQCEYTYIIAPKGVIPVDKIPAKIGLIEVDLDKYTIKRYNNFIFTGITTTKQCSSRKKELYKDNSKKHSIDVFNTLKKIAYRNTVNNVFKNAEIEVIGLR